MPRPVSPQQQRKENGNAFVYVLIGVVLFAALSFILIRQEDQKETNILTPDTAKIIATQLITTATQVKGALDQMIFAGTDVSEFNYNKPAAFGAAPHYDKVFHPEGGGISLPAFPNNALPSSGAVGNPPSGWYLGSFNNVEWSKSTADDVILTAYGMNEMVCQEINRILTGTTDIPTMTVDSKNVLIDDSEHSGTNTTFTTALCTDCEGVSSLCVENSAQDRYAFYNILFGE